ncbi:MAG: hypothetical protein PXY39_03295 [archaeon]|nr:hypothetical protein [archaeon]
MSQSSDSVTVYGLSSEGYQIGAKLASKGYEVFIVDENLGTGMILRPHMAGDYPELRDLLADEPLLDLKSGRDCVNRSSVIFFSPKLRRNEEDVLSEVKSRLSDLSKNISPGSMIVFCLPLGLFGSKEIIERIEHGSGLSSQKDFVFVYSPLEGGKPSVFGTDGKLDQHFQTIEAAGFSMEISSVSKAELLHAQKLLSKYSGLASTFEAAKRLTGLGFESPREYKQIFADDLSSLLFDLRLIVESVETGDPMLYLGSGSLKSIEGYSRFLVERIRELVKSRDLKASRLKITLFTDTDALEMRGDKISMARGVQERLRDFFSDIEYLNIMKEGFSFPMGIDKVNLMVFLSGSAEQRLTQLYEDQINMTKSQVIRANLPVEFVG